jgi:hypothetical protein
MGLAAALALTACSVGTTASGVAEPPAIAPGAPIGTSDPILVDPMPGGSGEPTIPQLGQLDVHPVPADWLDAALDGRAVTLKVSWTSGVEPCSVLDSIVVDRVEMAFAITLREGHAPGDNVCIEIAKFKFALVYLGELEPGTYTITDSANGAAPIHVVVT